MRQKKRKAGKRKGGHKAVKHRDLRVELVKVVNSLGLIRIERGKRRLKDENFGKRKKLRREGMKENKKAR